MKQDDDEILLKISGFSVTAVTVAAQLSAVLSEARNISLEAMNARALVARAGDNVRTFRPITDYMIELASDTIRLVQEINHEALKLSRVALKRLDVAEAKRRFQHAQRLAQGASYLADMRPLVHQARQDELQQQRQLKHHLRQLTELLDEIELRMLAAHVVAATSRQEAATVEYTYKVGLEDIVNKLETAAERIRSIAHKSRSLLRNNQYQ